MASSPSKIRKQNFDVYQDNGGTVVAISGNNFAVIASDTRLISESFTILSRNETKLFKVSNNAVLGSTGCWADVLIFRKIVEMNVKMYKFKYNTDIETPALAQLISNMMYMKRFFPYYISNILAGLDENGKGCIYHYDAIGHCEKVKYIVGGSSKRLIQPLLDCQIGRKNIENEIEINLSLSETIILIKNAFISAAERDINTGDDISVAIITREGIREQSHPLRCD